MKKIRIAAAALSLTVAVGVLGSMTYFTGGARTTNVITTGGVSIELLELSDSGNGIFDIFRNKTGVMPGTSVSKIVQVRNTGASDAYVRVKVDKTITLDEDRKEKGSGQPDTDLIEMDYNLDDWELRESENGGDGYYYYGKALAPGETTEPLFTEASFDSSMGNMYQGCRADIDVQAQAVQVKNNGSDVLEAAGWPASQKADQGETGQTGAQDSTENETDAQ